MSIEKLFERSEMEKVPKDCYKIWLYAKKRYNYVKSLNFDNQRD